MNKLQTLGIALILVSLWGAVGFFYYTSMQAKSRCEADSAGINQVIRSFGKQTAQGDLNHDGHVDIVDLSIALSHATNDKCVR